MPNFHCKAAMACALSCTANIAVHILVVIEDVLVFSSLFAGACRKLGQSFFNAALP